MERKDTVKACSRADKTHDADALRAILAEEAELIVPTTKPGGPYAGPRGDCPTRSAEIPTSCATRGRVRSSSMKERRTAQDTREQLLTAAAEEFAQHGPQGARVQEIVRRAGINERMIYHYFGSKDELYQATLLLRQRVLHAL